MSVNKKACAWGSRAAPSTHLISNRLAVGGRLALLHAVARDCVYGAEFTNCTTFLRFQPKPRFRHFARALSKPKCFKGQVPARASHRAPSIVDHEYSSTRRESKHRKRSPKGCFCRKNKFSDAMHVANRTTVSLVPLHSAVSISFLHPAGATE